MKLRTLAVISLLIFVGLFAFQPPVMSDEAVVTSQTILTCAANTVLPNYSNLVLDESQNLVYAVDSLNDALHVVDLTDLSVQHVFGQGLDGYTMALSPDGTQLAFGARNTKGVHFFDTVTLQQQAVLTVSVDYYYRPGDMAYLTDDLLIHVPINSRELMPIQLYDLTDMSLVAETAELFDSAPSIFLAPDKTEMYALNHEERIYRYQVSPDGFTLLGMNPETTTYSGWNACLMPDQDLIYTGDGQVWSTDLSTLVTTFDNATCGRIACATGQDRFLLAGIGYACEDIVLGYDTSTLDEIYRIPLGTGSHPIAIRSDGTKVLIGNQGSMLYYGTDWQTRTYMPLTLQNECQPDFFDDFSDIASSFWPEYEDGYLRVGIVDNEYQIYSKNKDYWYSVYAPTCNREHYQIDVDMHWEDEHGLLYGLLFGVTEDRSQYYLFAIEPNSQYVHLYYATPAGFEKVESSFSFEAVHRFGAVNHLTVRYYGSRVEVFVNGQQYFSGWSKSINDPGGYTGTALMSMPYPTTNDSDARFDNFAIRELNASAAVIASVESSAACVPPDDLIHMMPIPTSLLP